MRTVVSSHLKAVQSKVDPNGSGSHSPRGCDRVGRLKSKRASKWASKCLLGFGTVSLASALWVAPLAVTAQTLSTEDLLSSYVKPAPKVKERVKTTSTIDSPDVIHLRAAIRRYQRLVNAGGWPSVKRGRTLRPGDRHARIAQFRARLKVTKDYREAEPVADETLYDAQLHRAVRRFQLRHGLRADGIVGKSTVAAMNETASEKLRRLRLNLQRYRTLPRHTGQHVVVNIPEYRMRLLDDRAEVLQMNVVVGKSRFPTPEISDKIDYIVLNPYWNLPRTIAVREVLPKLKEDPSYLQEQQMEVLQGSKVLNPAELSWQTFSENQFPVRLRQRPGPSNALGSMKFIFPNPHNVYLHDTPSRWAFNKSKRALSHGCIRLADPAALAQALVEGNSKVRSDELEEMTSSGNRKVVTLRQSIPVDIVYLTAKADASMVWFFRDLYRRDAPDAALSQTLLADAAKPTLNDTGFSLYETSSDSI